MRRIRRNTLVTILVLVAVAASACTAIVPSARAAGLEAFDSCAAFAGHVKDEALRRVGPYGLQSHRAVDYGSADVAEAPAADAQAKTGESGGAAPDFSGTNVQEAGIDEPDIVKTDGRTIYAIDDSVLYAIDTTGQTPVVVDRLDLGGRSGDLLIGDRNLLVVGNGRAVRPARTDVRIPDGRAATHLTWVDTEDPGRLAVVHSVDVDGHYVDARSAVSDAGVMARLVLRTSTPDLGFEDAADKVSAAEAEADNRKIIEDSAAGAWLPTSVEVAADGRPVEATRRPVVSCTDVMRPAEFTGFEMLSVVGIAVDAPDADTAESGGATIEASAVLGGADTVYASAGSVYVATQTATHTATNRDGSAEALDIIGVPIAATTQIHRFDVADTDVAYVGSGTVAGELLDQFAMSEHDGVLRVATTSGDFDIDGDAAESFVTTLRADGDRLAEVGRVGGLGKGERIYSVRFMGDRGYVVTFRETDPLYSLDLSDPAQPAVTGELKIMGYSAYLHPVDDGLLLGVGQDATAEGRRLGTQVSLFDVSDPAAPARIAQWMPDAGRWSASEVEHDHHAFTYWQPTSTAFVPVSGPRGGHVVALDVRPGEITARGSVEHPSDKRCQEPPPIGPEPRAGDAPTAAIEPYCYDTAIRIRRSLVIGDTLYTLSDAGLLASELASLTQTGWLPFG